MDFGTVVSVAMSVDWFFTSSAVFSSSSLFDSYSSGWILVRDFRLVRKLARGPMWFWFFTYVAFSNSNFRFLIG